MVYDKLYLIKHRRMSDFVPNLIMLTILSRMLFLNH